MSPGATWLHLGVGKACVGVLAGYRLTAPLETERLVLRAYREDDFDALFAMRSSPEVARYLYWEPQTESEVRRTLALKIESVSLEAQGDVLALAAEHRESGALVGDVILRWVSLEHALGELGYIVHPDHAGHGYATEMARPLLAVAFDAVGLHRVIGSVQPENTASVRVLEKLGMRREAHFVENEFVKGEWQSELVYAILAEEWRAQR